MAQLKEKLEERITLFYNETQHLIPERINDYVVDYALDPFSDKIWIVEMYFFHSFLFLLFFF